MDHSREAADVISSDKHPYLFLVGLFDSVPNSLRVRLELVFDGARATPYFLPILRKVHGRRSPVLRYALLFVGTNLPSVLKVVCLLHTLSACGQNKIGVAQHCGLILVGCFS